MVLMSIVLTYLFVMMTKLALLVVVPQGPILTQI